jgi:hypothetical protein
MKKKQQEPGGLRCGPTHLASIWVPLSTPEIKLAPRNMVELDFIYVYLEILGDAGI